MGVQILVRKMNNHHIVCDVRERGVKASSMDTRVIRQQNYQLPGGVVGDPHWGYGGWGGVAPRIGMFVSS